jgi:hypothetical protein
MCIMWTPVFILLSVMPMRKRIITYQYLTRSKLSFGITIP